ncbi:hypothetical protein PV783_14035 [Chitinophaga sp. CC14]|uniref:hypothetical protein n=1 Tax=Chitinophaga sp. CC14 TaxID=3029199 RepID=UPI003B7A4A6E
MKKFLDLYLENIILLKSRGFHESNLNSPFKIGELFRSLKINLALAYKNGFREGENQTFSLKAVGFFNDCKDLLISTLNYEFDFQKEELRLKSVSFFDGKSMVTVNLKTPLDPPKATDGFDLIKESRLQIKKSMNRYIPVYTTNISRKKK